MTEPTDAPDTEAAAAPAAPANDTPPDRLSIHPSSPYFGGDLLERGIGIRFKGVEKTNVEEYSISESWVRVAVGNTRDRKGNPLTIKLQGPVEAYFRDIAEQA
jgi:hypothetical protein